MFNEFITNIFTSLRVVDIVFCIDVMFSVQQATLLMHTEWRCQPFYSDQMGDNKYSCISTSLGETINNKHKPLLQKKN